MIVGKFIAHAIKSNKEFGTVFYQALGGKLDFY
jgi:hypothetical protein